MTQLFDNKLVGNTEKFEHFIKLAQMLEKYGESPTFEIEIMPAQLIHSGGSSLPNAEYSFDIKFQIENHKDHPDLVWEWAKMGFNQGSWILDIAEEFWDIFDDNSDAENLRPTFFITPTHIFCMEETWDENFRDRFIKHVEKTGQMPVSLLSTTMQTHAEQVVAYNALKKYLPHFVSIYKEAQQI